MKCDKFAALSLLFSFAFEIVSLSTCSCSTLRAESMIGRFHGYEYERSTRVANPRSSSLLACRLGAVNCSGPIIDIFLGTGRSAYKSQYRLALEFLLNTV